MPKKIEVPEGMGWCSKCKQALPLDSFHISRCRKSGRERYCKACRRQHTRKLYDQTPLVIPPEGKLYCGHCKTIKDKAEFSTFQANPAKGRAYRNSGCCRQCASNYAYREMPKRRTVRFAQNHPSFKPLSKTLSTEPTELAYYAGLFDAEGSAQMSNSRDASPFMTIANNNSIILEACQWIMGGSIRYFERVATKGSITGMMVSEGRIVISTLAHVGATCNAIIQNLKIKRDRCEILKEASISSPARRIELRPLLGALNEKCQIENFNIPPPRHVSMSEARQISDVDIAYLSGYVDGDGWLGVFQGDFTISITSSKFASLSFFHSIFGGKIISMPSQIQHATVCHWAPCFEANVMEYILSRMASYLTLKRRHAEIWIQAMNGGAITKADAALKMRRLTKEARMEKFKRVWARIEKQGRTIGDKANAEDKVEQDIDEEEREFGEHFSGVL